MPFVGCDMAQHRSSGALLRPPRGGFVGGGEHWLMDWEPHSSSLSSLPHAGHAKSRSKDASSLTAKKVPRKFTCFSSQINHLLLKQRLCWLGVSVKEHQ